MYVCALQTWGARRGQKKVSDTLELEFSKGVSCHLGVENQTWVCYKSSKCSSALSHLSSPMLKVNFILPSQW